jgi:hypothetical protein
MSLKALKLSVWSEDTAMMPVFVTPRVVSDASEPSSETQGRELKYPSKPDPIFPILFPNQHPIALTMSEF